MNPRSLPPSSPPAALRASWQLRRHLPHLPLPQCLCVVTLLLALVAVSIPAVSQSTDDQARTRALAMAKQVGLALKLFAGDNDGQYPRDGVPEELHAPTTSNAAFATLFPTYTQSETIFGNVFSAYQTHPPDNAIDMTYDGKPVKTLAPGENVLAYVMGLNDTMNAGCPLVVDGTDGTGHYVTDPTKRGGVWGGTVAIVVHLDNSALLARLAGPANARFIPMGELARALGGKFDDNLLDVARLGKGVKLLDPAIAPAK